MLRRFDPVEGRNADIIEAVMACPEVTCLDDAMQFKVRLCVEEVEENILGYSGSSWVEVRVDNDGNELTISFKDGGVEFNPLEREDPDVTASLDERTIGGLGIFICKQMMDSVEYRYEEGCNKFIMKINRQ